MRFVITSRFHVGVAASRIDFLDAEGALMDSRGAHTAARLSTMEP
jgi:hypothetical protein